MTDEELDEIEIRWVNNVSLDVSDVFNALLTHDIPALIKEIRRLKKVEMDNSRWIEKESK